MNFLALFATLGYIFGPTIFLSGILAIVVCINATRVPRSTQIARRAFIYSLVPWFISLIGAIFGIIFVAATGGSFEKAGGWGAVGQTFLAGFVVSLIPLIWSLLLFPRGGAAGRSPAVVE